MLKVSDHYDRAAGFFTATSLQLLTAGLKDFVARRGKMRLVISPVLTDEDLQQINDGYASREAAIEASAASELDALAVLSGPAVSRLAWLIANDVLDIRFATPAGKRAGLYHEKFGIFKSGTDVIAFTGSLNETAAALSRNIEYIDAYASWVDPSRTADKEEDFESLWDGTAFGVVTSTFPDAVRKSLFTKAPQSYIDELEDETGSPGLELRPRQRAAIDAWSANEYRGLLAMATGTGKTFTALGAAMEQLRSDVRTIVILVPQIALADQWAVEVQSALNATPIVCHSQTDWRLRLKTAVLLARNDPVRKIITVTTYDTAESSEFTSALLDAPSTRLLIADEVHNVNVDVAQRVLLDTYSKRLGLSATPERWMDADGTATLLDYFSGIVYRYSLSEAVNDGTLTPYDYFPIVCYADDARSQYSDLPLPSNARVSRFADLFRSSVGFESGYCLVYTNYQSIETILLFLGRSLGLPVHTFTAIESAEERRRILYQFGSGELHSLVAMRCLDEGIDVPATRTAYLLASSINPKQFVQRRGRVLRRFPGKHFATIFDFIFLERISSDSKRQQVQNEINRFAEFASVATNSGQAVQTLRDAASALGIDLAEFFQGV